MADEITLNARLRCTNGSLKIDVNPGQLSIDQSTLGGGGPGTVEIGTSEEDISFGDISTLGLCHITNLDTTNYVQLGPKSAGSMVAGMRLNPGESYVLRLEPGVTYRAIANTAACKVSIICLEN